MLPSRFFLMILSIFSHVAGRVRNAIGRASLRIPILEVIQFKAGEVHPQLTAVTFPSGE